MKLSGIIKSLAISLLSVSAVHASESITLTTDNFVSIKGEVTDESIQTVLDKIYLTAPSKVLYIYLDTPGGSVDAGMRLVRYMQSSNRDIRCIAQQAQSMGMVILQACPTRFVTFDTLLMAHKVAWGSGTESIEEHRTELIEGEKVQEILTKIISSRLKISPEELNSKMHTRYVLIGARDALAGKAADKEAKIKCTREVERTKVIVKADPLAALFGARDSKHSMCPF